MPVPIVFGEKSLFLAEVYTHNGIEMLLLERVGDRLEIHVPKYFGDSGRSNLVHPTAVVNIAEITFVPTDTQTWFDEFCRNEESARIGKQKRLEDETE